MGKKKKENIAAEPVNKMVEAAGNKGAMDKPEKVIKEDEKTKEPADEMGRISTGRYICTAVVCIIMFLITAVSIVCYRGYHELSNAAYNAGMRLKAVETSEKQSEEIIKRGKKAILKRCDEVAGVLSKVLGSLEVDQALIDNLSKNLGDGYIICYMDNGEIYKSSGYEGDEPERSEVMKNEGTVILAEGAYSYCPFDGGFVLLHTESGFENTFDLAESEGYDTLSYIIDKETGCIKKTSNTELMGKRAGECFVNMILFNMSREEWNIDADFGIMRDADNRLYMYAEKVLQSGDTVIVTVSAVTIIQQMFSPILLQIALSFIVFLIVTVHALFMLGRRRKKAEERNGRRFFGKVYLDTKQFSQLLGFLAFSVLITLFLTLYIQLLKGYSNRNMDSRDNLDVAEYCLLEADRCMAAVESESIKYYNQIGDFVTALYERGSDEELDELLAYVIKNTMIDRMDIYSNQGVSISSSTGYTGYTLSQDEESTDLLLRQILNTSDSMIFKEFGNDYYLAQKCTGKAGAIGMRIDGSIVGDLSIEYQAVNSLEHCSFGWAEKILIDTEAPSSYYVMGTSEENGLVSRTEMNFGDYLLEGDFSGNATIGKNLYDVRERSIGKYVIISAMKVRDIINNAVSGLFIEFLGFVCLFIILVCFTCFFKGSLVETSEKIIHIRETNLDRLINGKFRKSITAYLIAAAFALVIVALVENFVFNNSMLQYLTGSEWERNLNLFSVTIIIVVIIAAYFARFIITKIIELIGRNLGARGATISQMLCSLVKFGTLAGVIIFSCVQLGANLAYMMTGAGFAGMVIGYAGQGIINDLLSGLFIVFEGNIQVGDWVRIGDWDGQVMEIGVRTTKIAKGGDVKVINNAGLSNVTVWGHNMEGAICLVDIAYEEDADAVIRLIEDNVSRYQEQDPHITEGPRVHGIINLGESGVTIRMSASVDDEFYAGRCERNMRRITKKLFDENGISIPYNQLVVHEADKK